MPIYEYQCSACGHEFEEWQKMSDAPIRTCPKCAKETVDKLISHTAFQLKGGGWYKDLYSSTGNPKSKEAASESGGDKPAAKAADKGSSDKGGGDKGGGGQGGGSQGGDKGGDKGGSDKKADSKPDSGKSGGGSGSSGSTGGGSKAAAGSS